MSRPHMITVTTPARLQSDSIYPSTRWCDSINNSTRHNTKPPLNVCRPKQSCNSHQVTVPCLVYKFINPSTQQKHICLDDSLETAHITSQHFIFRHRRCNHIHALSWIQIWSLQKWSAEQAVLLVWHKYGSLRGEAINRISCQINFGMYRCGACPMYRNWISSC